jgi:hypothetical protein
MHARRGGGIDDLHEEFPTASLAASRCSHSQKRVREAMPTASDSVAGDVSLSHMGDRPRKGKFSRARSGLGRIDEPRGTAAMPDF